MDCIEPLSLTGLISSKLFSLFLILAFCFLTTGELESGEASFFLNCFSIINLFVLQGLSFVICSKNSVGM
jgi:hypothetical protein